LTFHRRQGVTFSFKASIKRLPRPILAYTGLRDNSYQKRGFVVHRGYEGGWRWILSRTHKWRRGYIEHRPGHKSIWVSLQHVLIRVNRDVSALNFDGVDHETAAPPRTDFAIGFDSSGCLS